MHFKPKKIKGISYLYLIENQRVDGKVKQVQQICVGSADKIKQMLDENKNNNKKMEVQSFPFGKAAALLYAADQIKLVEAIDEATSKKKMKGLTVGQFILTMIAARADGETSRSRIADWFKDSILEHILEPKYSLSSQNLLNQLARLDEDAINRIEDSLARNLEKIGVRPKNLIFDTTNQYTHIKKGETLTKKGRSKAKRNDKNLVGLGLVVNEFNMPFMSMVYPGNEHDSVVFNKMITKMTQRLEQFGTLPEDLTIVFDRGINSDENLEFLENDFHVVGALPRSLAGELLDTPMEKFSKMYMTSKKLWIQGFESKGTYYERPFRVVVQFNSATKENQMKNYLLEKKKVLDTFERLKISCTRTGKGRKPSEKGIINNIADCIQKDMRGIFEYGIEKLEKGHPCPWIKINTSKENRLLNSFGKTAVFTDKWDIPACDVLKTYNSKWMIEDDFRWFNDVTIIPICPIHVRKDLSIRAHVFISVIGLMLYRFILWKLNMMHLSMQELVDNLERIKIALVIEEGRKAKFVLEKIDKESLAIVTALDLMKYIPE